MKLKLSVCSRIITGYGISGEIREVHKEIGKPVKLHLAEAVEPEKRTLVLRSLQKPNTG